MMVNIKVREDETLWNFMTGDIKVREDETFWIS